MDIRRIRKDFPVLKRKVHGKQLVYLDNAATTQKPQSVIDAVSSYYSQHNANVHRGIHTLSEESTVMYEGAHEAVARFIGARSWREVVFTKNATEALNLVAVSLSRKGLEKGDEILVTEMEHHSNLVPWQQLAAQYGFTVRFAPVDEKTGELDIENLQESITKRTRVIAVTHMSNVLGTINPVKDISAMAHEHDAYCVVDGAQSVPHIPVDVSRIGCDFLALSGHKMLGPTGIGVLYGREEVLEDLPPFLYGGDMINSVTFEESSWNDLPWKFEAGTPIIAQAAGLKAAVEYLGGIGMENAHAHEQKLVDHAFDVLGGIGGVRIYGPKKRGGVVSFWTEGVHPHDLAAVLDNEGIAIRAGHHCAQPLVTRMGVPALARASFTVYNTLEEVDALAAGVRKAKKMFT